MSKETDAQQEKDLVDLGLTNPRVTKDQIDALMKQVTYKCNLVEGTTTTLAVAILPIGSTEFTLAIGQSACVDKRNFNEIIGMEFAIQDAEEKARNRLWELEGYHLAKTLNK